MARQRQYWLLKCEPTAYTIEQLERDGSTSWEGVRNYQARNFLRAMRRGDRALFYASNASPSGVTGVVQVSREAYPDPRAFEKGHVYYDPRSRPEAPTWVMVGVTFVARFPAVLTLETLKATRALATMMVVQPGRRPSVQPVTAKEFETVVGLARSGGRRKRG